MIQVNLSKTLNVNNNANNVCSTHPKQGVIHLPQRSLIHSQHILRLYGQRRGHMRDARRLSAGRAGQPGMVWMTMEAG